MGQLDWELLVGPREGHPGPWEDHRQGHPGPWEGHRLQGSPHWEGHSAGPWEGHHLQGILRLEMAIGLPLLEMIRLDLLLLLLLQQELRFLEGKLPEYPRRT